MLKVKYAIYKIDTDCYDGLETYITRTDDILEVATKLIEISNPSIQDLVNFARKEMPNNPYVEGLVTTIRKYILNLSNEIKNYYNQNNFFQFPIDHIPDFTYLNNWRVHKFIIEDYDKTTEDKEEFSIPDFLEL